MKNIWIFLLLFASNALYLAIMDFLTIGETVEAFRTLVNSYIAITFAEQMMIYLYLAFPVATAFFKWRKARASRTRS